MTALFLENRIFLWVGLLLFSIVFGCASIQKDHPEKQLFRLDTGPAGFPIACRNSEKGLLTKRFFMSPEFDSLSITYRVDDTRFTTDYYNTYMVSPSRMVTEIVAEALYATPCFFAAAADVPAQIHYRLRGKILELYGDARKDLPFSAVIQVRITLEKQTQNGFIQVLDRIYAENEPLSQKSAKTLVEGFNTGLSRILEEFFSDLNSSNL